MRISNFDRLLKFLGGARWLLVTVALLLAVPVTFSTASAQVVLSVAIAPPALPVYTQPICPEEGYIWTPGYWSYTDDGGYFWVPGTWVEPPAVGLLWTPGYWGWNSGAYVWNAGYWGPQVGFYGGINYGFGYSGIGYGGGYWRGSNFFYNSRVNNVNVAVVHNVYQKTIVVHNTHVSYNGGRGGVTARPTAEQERFAREHHTAQTAVQEQHISAARSDRNQFASANHGRPAVQATQRPGEFKGPRVVQTKASASDRLQPKAESETRTESKPTSTHESKPEATPRTEKKSAARESKPEAKPEAKPQPAPKRTTTHESKSEAVPKTESKRTTTHESEPVAKPKTETKPPATSHESKTEAKPQTESKPVTAREPKSEVKPQSEPKPATKHESKPPSQHEAAPPREEKPPKD